MQHSFSEVFIALGWRLVWRRIRHFLLAPLLFAFPEVYQPVVRDGDKVPDDETGDECVGKSDEAPYKGHSVSDEELAQQREMGTDNLPSLENQPIRRNEDCQAEHETRDDTVNLGI
jgi:hypothetical protein